MRRNRFGGWFFNDPEFNWDDPSISDEYKQFHTEIETAKKGIKEKSLQLAEKMKVLNLKIQNLKNEISALEKTLKQAQKEKSMTQNEFDKNNKALYDNIDKLKKLEEKLRKAKELANTAKIKYATPVSTTSSTPQTSSWLDNLVKPSTASQMDYTIRTNPPPFPPRPVSTTSSTETQTENVPNPLAAPMSSQELRNLLNSFGKRNRSLKHKISLVKRDIKKLR